MNIEDKKKLAAEAALDYIQIDDVVGVGTGSTANYFIDALAKMKNKIDGTVASSEASAQRLQSLVGECNDARMQTIETLSPSVVLSSSHLLLLLLLSCY